MATQKAPRERSLFNTFMALITWLFLALIFSILLEWMGMFLGWWPQSGSGHSRAMLDAEIGYLSSDFKRSVMTSDPAGYAATFASQVYYWLFEWTGLTKVVAWLNNPPDVASNAAQQTGHNLANALAEYFISAMTITQVFALRLSILTLALPVFLLSALVGITDGLAKRDIRRWQGGRESSFLYHYAKRLSVASLILPWVVYLALPFSLNPAWVILPCAASFGLMLAVTSATFKKYL